MMLQEELQKEVSKLMKFLEDSQIEKIGPMINTTFGIEIINGQQFMDTEFMIPVGISKINNENYKIKKEFILINALYTKHKGNPIGLQKVYEEMNEYAKREKLQFVTGGYNVFINETNNPEDFEIDVYIGINPNKL